MNGLKSKTVAAVLAVAFVSLEAMPAYAEAAPEPEPVEAGDAPGEVSFADEEPTRTRAEIEQAHIPEDEVASIAEHYGISAEQARQRIQVEMATVGLDQRLHERWPDSYAGSWNDDDGSPEVVVAFAGTIDDPARRREAIAEEFAFPEFLVIRDGMAQSLTEIEDAYRRLAGDIERLHKGQGHPRAALRETEGHFGVGLDIRGNRLTVTLPETTRNRMGRRDGKTGAQRLRDAVVQHYGIPNATVESVGDFEDNCARSNCQWTMVSGLALVWETNACTAGFGVARGTDRFVLSAAHCPGQWRRNGPDGHYGRRIDQTNGQWNGGGMDVELVQHEMNTWTTYGGIALFESGETFRAINFYSGYNSYNTTHTIGMSGVGSNAVNRGQPTNVSWSGTLNGTYYSDMVRANYCSTDGDSGAPVFRNDVAMGIHKGSFTACDALFTKIARARDRFNVNILGGSPPASTGGGGGGGGGGGSNWPVTIPPLPTLPSPPTLPPLPTPPPLPPIEPSPGCEVPNPTYPLLGKDCTVYPSPAVDCWIANPLYPYSPVYPECLPIRGFTEFPPSPSLPQYPPSTPPGPACDVPNPNYPLIGARCIVYAQPYRCWIGNPLYPDVWEYCLIGDDAYP